MSNDVTELRSTLFEALRDLKEGKLDLDRAKAINETAQTIINTAKVEVDHMRINSAIGTAFFTKADEKKPALPDGTSVVTKKPGVTVTRHQLKG